MTSEPHERNVEPPQLVWSARARARRRVLGGALVVVWGLAVPFFAGAAPPAADAPRDAGQPHAPAPPADASVRDAAASRIPPDPPPMRERTQWVFDLRWDKGDVYLVGVHKLELPAPQETPRAMGRFAIELFEGPTVIERVRFDFPLLGDEARDGGYREIPYFGKKLSTRIGVMFPATSRGTKLVLWDRASDKRWDLPWPPTDSRLLPRDAAADADDLDAGSRR